MAQKQGGTLTVGLELDIPGFDPLKVGVYDTAGNIAASLIFDTLTSLDDNGKAQPKLAVSWSSSDDYKTWTYKLRPDVKFQDGTPFNAEAVEWNFDRQKDPKNNCRCAFYIAYINSVEAKDELTVVFNLRDPVVNMPVLLVRPDQNSVDAVAVGDPGQGRRLQSQSGRHRSLHHEVVDGGRPHGARAQSRLLEQGPSLSRPRRAAAAARFAVALRQPAVGRDRRGVGRRVRGRQHPAGAEGHGAAGACLCRLGRRGLCVQHQGRRRSTTCACARRW